jgi:hypothetical protein
LALLVTPTRDASLPPVLAQVIGSVSLWVCIASRLGYWCAARRSDLT